MNTRKLSDYDVIGIFDGFVECTSASMYLRACKALAARPHLRGIANGSGTSRALEVAAYAKTYGNDAALDMLEGNE